MTASTVVEWIPRSEPLLPCAVAAWDVAGRRLAHHLLRRQAWKGLRGLAADDILIMSGAADQLPWVDGVVYLGGLPTAPSILVPTLLRPSFAEELFVTIVHRQLDERHVAILPQRQAAVPLAALGPIDGDALVQWSNLPVTTP